MEPLGKLPTTHQDAQATRKPYDPYSDALTIWKNGRPYKYSTLSEPAGLIDTYFLECETLGKTPNVAGLALALDTDYKTLLRWEQLKGEEEDTDEENAFKAGLSQMIRRAKTKCAERWFPGLEDRDKARGSEFALKVMGYQDKPDNSGVQNITINQQNVLIGNPEHLGDLFGGILAGPVQKALAKPGERG